MFIPAVYSSLEQLHCQSDLTKPNSQLLNSQCPNVATCCLITFLNRPLFVKPKFTGDFRWIVIGLIWLCVLLFFRVSFHKEPWPPFVSKEALNSQRPLEGPFSPWRGDTNKHTSAAVALETLVDVFYIENVLHKHMFQHLNSLQPSKRHSDAMQLQYLTVNLGRSIITV